MTAAVNSYFRLLLMTACGLVCAKQYFERR